MEGPVAEALALAPPGVVTVLHEQLRILAIDAAAGQWPVRGGLHYLYVERYEALVELNVVLEHLTVLRFSAP